MVRPRRKSFWAANERIALMAEASQKSQISLHNRSDRSRSPHRPNASQSEDDFIPDERPARRRVRLTAIDEPQTHDQRQNQRRTRSKSTQDREDIADQPEVNNNKPNQRRTRAKSTQVRADNLDSQSTIDDTPQTNNQKQNQRRTRSKSTHDRENIVNEPELISNKPNQRRTRAKSTHKLANIPDSQSTIDDELQMDNENQVVETQPTISMEAERPAQRTKRLTAVEEKEPNDNGAGRRQYRLKSTQQRGIAVQPEVHNNDENQRQTRSKTKQQRTNATKPNEPSKMSNQILDEPESSDRNKSKRQKSSPKKLNAVGKIQMRRKTLMVNDRELNELVDLAPSNEIPMVKDIFIRLDRLDSATIQQYLGNSGRPMRQSPAENPKSMACNGPTARRIINRRCTVNMDRIDVSQHQPRHHDNNVQLEPSLPTPQPPAADLLSSSPHETEKAIDQSDDDADSSVVTPDSGLPSDRVDSPEVEPDQADQMSDASTYFEEEIEETAHADEEGESAMDSESISVQNFVVTQSQLMVARERYEDMNANFSYDSRDFDVTAAVDAEADDEHDSDDNSSTYCSGNYRFTIIIAINILCVLLYLQLSGVPGLTPVNITQLLLSQASQYHAYDFDRSSSNCSVDVNYDGGETSGQFGSRAGEQYTRSKLFVDSANISYGTFVQYDKETFAINSLDHDKKTIRHHFLSKFSRDNIGAINTYTQGNLYMTETTGTSIYIACV